MQVLSEAYRGEDSEAYKELPDGIYRGVMVTIGDGTVQVPGNLIVRTMKDAMGTQRYSFAQVWR